MWVGGSVGWGLPDPPPPGAPPSKSNYPWLLALAKRAPSLSHSLVPPSSPRTEWVDNPTAHPQVEDSLPKRRTGMHTRQYQRA